MEEFSSRVEIQRHLVQAVNSRPWKQEQLFSLTDKAIQRWSIANGINPQRSLVQLLKSASSEVFVMANHSDDPIAGAYVLSRRRVQAIKTDIEAELSQWSDQ